MGSPRITPFIAPNNARGVGKAHKNRHPKRGPRFVWLKDVEEIMERIEATAQQYFDRRDIEHLFGVRSSAALKIMRQCGYCAELSEILGTGGRLQLKVIARRDLVMFIHKARHSPEFFQERDRREHLKAELAGAAKFLAARKVRIQADTSVRDMENLPAGVHLQPGELRIDFYGTEDLLRHLFELAQVITHDYVRFQQAIEG